MPIRQFDDAIRTLSPCDRGYYVGFCFEADPVTGVLVAARSPAETRALKRLSAVALVTYDEDSKTWMLPHIHDALSGHERKAKGLPPRRAGRRKNSGIKAPEIPELNAGNSGIKSPSPIDMNLTYLPSESHTTKEESPNLADSEEAKQTELLLDGGAAIWPFVRPTAPERDIIWRSSLIQSYYTETEKKLEILDAFYWLAGHFSPAERTRAGKDRDFLIARVVQNLRRISRKEQEELRAYHAQP